MVLECLHYNYNNSDPTPTCTGSFEQCSRTRACSHLAHLEPGVHCFLVWSDGPDSKPLSAGCNPPYNTTSESECGTECIGSPKGKNFYCCCTESLCNKNYKLPPPKPSKPPSIPKPKEIPNQSTTFSVLWSVIPAVLIITLICIIYKYKKKKDKGNNINININGSNTNGNQVRRNNNGINSGDLNYSELNELRNNRSISILVPFRNAFGDCFSNNNVNNTNSGSINDNINRQHKNNYNHHHHLHHHTQHQGNHHDHKNDHGTIETPLTTHYHHHHHHLHHQQHDAMTTTATSNNACNTTCYQPNNNFRIDLNTVKLLEIIGSGRFGTVHRACLSDNSTVAVKIIASSDQQSWLNEQQVYNSPLIKHPNILNFFYSDEHLETETYWLIVEYASKGSLYTFLKDNTITWKEFLLIALGIVHGLSHLHEANIVHRDFKSKNVLLRHDLTPCLTDFGVAAILDTTAGSQLDQRKKYLQVGTPRYMAPEVLECSVTFTKASFLKIDVYALSLVLWELMSRCRCPREQQETKQEESLHSDDSVGFPMEDYYFDQPPPYQLPFEEVAGPNPDINRMRQIVVVDKIRPPFREVWRQYPAAEFCRAIEDGWEYDHDARISASCFVERVEILNQNC